MIKSVLVAALSVTLISTGFASPHHKASRGHSKKETSKKSRKANSSSYNRGRRSVRVYEAETPKHHDIGRATITGKNINVRQSPSTGADVVKKVSGGNVAITAQKGDWYKIRCQYGTEGWVRADNLNIATKAPKVASKSSTKAAVAKAVNNVTPGSTRYANLVARTVKVYNGSSTTNSVATKVHGGKVLVVDKWNNWYRVKFEHGTIGWVQKEALEFPDNFDFKNAKHAPVVATKTPAKPKDNFVEIKNTGEIVTPETVAVKKPAKKDTGSATIMATVMGDRIDVRRGPSHSNSLISRIPGGPAQMIDKHGDWIQLRFPHGTVGWVNQSHVSYPGHEIVAAPKTYVASNYGSSSGSAESLMKVADTFRGIKYIYGTQSRHSTDCSGFTMQAFKLVHVDLPRTAAQQSKCGGAKISRWDLQTGDLIFFNTRGYVSHVGIYIGNQHFIHASSGGGRVMESSLNETYYSNRFLFGKRVLSGEKVRELKLPKMGELPTEAGDQRDDNRVDVVGDKKGQQGDH